MITKKRFGAFILCVLQTFSLQANFFFCTKFDLGFSKYHIGQAHLLDASNNNDYIQPTRTSFMPMVRGFLGYEYDDFGMLKKERRTTGRFGVVVEYTHKHNGVRSDYYDYGFGTSSLYTLQSVGRIDLQGFFEYDFAPFYSFNCFGGVGAGLTKDALKTLNIYQTSNNAFIGQSLEPHAFSPSGFLALGVRSAYKETDGIHYQITYHLGFTRVGYKEQIVQSQPSGRAGLYAQNAFDLLTDISLYRAPRFLVISNEFSLGIQWDF